ncbi:MAG: PQQ-like beta-propeller repeat protein [Prosthecobacter sp.]|uniref:outer membrane protein assembly factor BamB family protein n=1 Tax=Prosthecobacter sp. TaxID=1965333 RepID=UPI00260C88BB|nr:PQQ-binding-like beta-propeller repeat protein [Prosthecobacter sp.]MCF7789047.1 PQQ-like beta-propeller repeat protein [Prosthecobacter sp.]
MKFTLAFLTLFSVSVLSASDWARFRGPNGTGVAETTGLPAVVDESTTVWKVDTGKGWSSPVLWKDMVIVTAESSATTRAVIAFSAKDGKELWRHEETFTPHPLHKTYNTFASSSAFVDAERVYINWSSGTNIQALALDHTGKLVWRNDHVADYIHEHGTGVSALVVNGIMIVRSEFDTTKGGKDLTDSPEQKDWKSCIVGLDAKTGKQAWKLDLPNCLNTFSTPIVHNLPGGKVEIICSDTGSGVMGIDPMVGKMNWQYNPGFKQRSLGSGVISDDFYFCTFGSGGGGKEIAALDLKSGKPVPVAFEETKGLPYVPSPLVIGDYMYLLGDGGILRCVEFKTGKLVYDERVEGTQGSAKFFSSPVAGDGKIFCASQQGDLIVVKAGPKFEKIAASKLDAPINSVPAIGDKRIFVRTANSLYCIGAKGQPVP